MKYTSYDYRNNRYFSRSIFKRESWRKEARVICKEGSVTQKNYVERDIIQKFSSKNINQ